MRKMMMITIAIITIIKLLMFFIFILIAFVDSLSLFSKSASLFKCKSESIRSKIVIVTVMLDQNLK